jgi:predicted SprT family Zn-dependent metalloprotease
MDLDNAAMHARNMMELYQLDGWSFAFDNAKRRCGACYWGRRTITLSRHFVRLNNAAEVHDTILHEIAHALAGKAAGHGAYWRQVARQLGARPERCAENVEMPEGGVEGVCAENCTGRHVRHRMPPARLLNAYACRRCNEDITWVRVR